MDAQPETADPRGKENAVSFWRQPFLNWYWATLVVLVLFFLLRILSGTINVKYPEPLRLVFWLIYGAFPLVALVNTLFVVWLSHRFQIEESNQERLHTLRRIRERWIICFLVLTAIAFLPVIAPEFRFLSAIIDGWSQSALLKPLFYAIWQTQSSVSIYIIILCSALIPGALGFIGTINMAIKQLTPKPTLLGKALP